MIERFVEHLYYKCWDYAEEENWLFYPYICIAFIVSIIFYPIWFFEHYILKK